MFITDNAQEVLAPSVIIGKENPRNFKDIFSTFSMHTIDALILHDHKLR